MGDMDGEGYLRKIFTLDLSDPFWVILVAAGFQVVTVADGWKEGRICHVLFYRALSKLIRNPKRH